MSCDARIRPMRPINETEVLCEEPDGHVSGHQGTLRDYAYRGSATTMSWLDGDRRTFHGEWPGGCPDCILPLGHRGGHAS